MLTFLQKIFTQVSEILQNVEVKIGQNTISLNLILQLIISVIVVLIFSHFLYKILRNRLLVKFAIDEGNRDALASIITYITGGLGLILVLDGTGFNLASLAVLAGGLGIGLGFALQNVTENFLSGLTLLLERSVKVGDFIELWVSEEFQTLQGTVRKISLRSTIIQTNDGTSLIMPNSSLVQKPIINWKYQQNKNQIIILIKVDSNSDPLVVTETLLNSAYMEQSLAKDPPPKVIFNGFVDNSLEFELRVWTYQIEKKVDIKSSLNFIIQYNLRTSGILLPYHQKETDQNILPTDQQSNDKYQPLSLRVLLRKVTYFQKFNDIELRQLIEIGYRQRIKASDILFRENDPGNAFYIILGGSVEVFVEKINKHLSTLQTGQFFGELALMLAIPRTATVRALEDTNLFVINNKGFEKLLKKHPDLAEEIVQELGKHQEELASRQEQLRQLGLVDAAEDDNNPMVWVRKRLQTVFNL
ncbi:cyclic nucleotide-binding domain-containing protein [Iningainema tapete]|uniref:Mechanosensitive ion channel n=1 Tax=Iningainema tapete BLCC-T55 TaxID=2748662 RepID=A0A8J6XPN1_9CYAN|nr:cyclic nucleotide-binding domain-containing protein [Iningainema tapete]MBD2774157.1 mechanosensitive ion channel [Iningainema tapete BLCC-T55]